MIIKIIVMTIIAHPKNKKQEAAIEAVLKALNVSFQKEEESPYNPEFVAKIKARAVSAERGNVTRIKDPKNIWESIL
ncbi:hypothetical protein QF042_002741 [Pedobacter sp. W3I1]|uniref:DUF2683 family protein n=1 Tax=Pedobacter sp. W3I1 TaxID=3042291 RepID=UPI0027819DDA|nr:DUF2683 family protein [Pedobacter sp. W3I1]MDQ0639176.1 hypothetical protein [Pedobacter sp. W3I1]